MRGPEGEEQDIIGSDGHSEQLPPYTRYPEESNAKPVGGVLPVTDNFGTTPATPLPPHATSPGPSADAGAPLENDATPNRISPSSPPPPQQQEQQRPSGQTQADTSSTSGFSEKDAKVKSWRDKTWKERLKTKLCRFLPIWVILLIVFVVFFIVVICSSVISLALHDSTTYRPSTNQTTSDHYSQQYLPISTDYSYIDSTPTSTPAGLPPLPTGTYVVPLGTPDEMYGKCLTGGQVGAWTCTLPAEQTLCVKLYEVNGLAVFDTCNTKPIILGYGTQPPIIYGQPLRLVTDLDNATLGPAWHFQTFYNKLVIIPHDMLEPPTAQLKRSLESSWTWPSFAGMKLSARDSWSPAPIKTGDQAWFCAWDDTFIEGFIYASVSNPSYAPTENPPATLYSEPSTITWTPSPTPTDGSKEAQVEAAEAFGPYITDSAYDAIRKRNPFAEAHQGYPSPSAYSDYTGYPEYQDEASVIPSTMQQSTTLPDPKAYTTASTPPSRTPPSPATTTAPSASSTSCETSATPTTTPIPKLVKIEERRLSGLHDNAVCTLMQKLDNLSFNPVGDPTGQPIIITLDETDGPNGVNDKVKRWLERGAMRPSGGGAALVRRGSYKLTDIEQTCYCQWSSEQFE